MAFSLTVSAITPPDGLPHTNRKDEILSLPTYLCVTGTSGLSALKLIYVGVTAPGPENIDDVWLKTDEVGTAHGFYLYDSTLGVWLLMGGPGVVSGTTAPTDTNVLWLKTDSVNAVLTPGGVTVTAPQGLYKFNGTSWVCATTTAASAKEVYVQATAPTGASDIAWIKTADEKGIWYWNGSAWVNAAAMSAIGTIAGIGFATAYTQISAAAPVVAIRPYTLWAKIGSDTPNGLFWPDIANGYWESIYPITIGKLDYGPLGMTSGTLYDTGALPFSILSPNIGTAYFPIAPLMSITLSDDSQFSSGGYINLGATSTTTTFALAGYHASGVSPRNVKINVTAIGMMRIPF